MWLIKEELSSESIIRPTASLKNKHFIKMSQILKPVKKPVQAPIAAIIKSQ